jgi:hypothetical protein
MSKLTIASKVTKITVKVPLNVNSQNLNSQVGEETFIRESIFLNHFWENCYETT